MGKTDSGELARLLRQYRRARGLSQEELANRVVPRLSVATIRNLEGGRTRPYRHTVEAVGRALDLDAAQMAEVLALWRGQRAAGGMLASQPSQDPPAVRGDDPFVGRAAELDVGRAAYLAAAGERGQLLSISGESGVGKTRLAEELGRWVVDQGGTFLRGQYARETTAFAAWVEALRPLLVGLEQVDLARLAGPHWALLSLISPDVVDPAAAQPLVRQLEAGLLTPADQRQRLNEAVVRLLRNASAERPLMLLLDDLHWAPGLDLLAHVARSLDSMRVLLVTNHRAFELAEREEVATGLDELLRQRNATWVRLDAFTEEETVLMAGAQLGEQEAGRLGGAVWRATGGNPFLVRETLQSLREGRLTEVYLPPAARGIVLERVRGLGEGALDVLTQASVLGGEFAYRDLLALTGLDDESLVDLCERALTAGILLDRSSAGEERYRFRDDHVADALHESASPPRLRRWHLRAGQIVEERAEPDTPERTALLARHFVRGGDVDRGGRYSMLAGEQAEQVYAWSAAIGHYRTALRLWEHTPGYTREQAEVNHRLGVLVCQTAADTTAGITALHRALRLYEKLGDVAGRVQVHTWLGLEHAASASLRVRDQRKADEHLNAARALAVESGSAAELCAKLIVRAQSCTYRLDTVGAVAAAREAREMAERSGNAGAACQAQLMLGVMLAGTGRIAEGRTLFDKGLATATRDGLEMERDFAAVMQIWLDNFVDPRRMLCMAETHEFRETSKWSTVYTPIHVVGACAYTGDFEVGDAALAGLQIELEHREQPAFGPNPQYLGRFLVRRGDWPRAEAMMDDALAWARQASDVAHVAFVQAVRGELFLCRGELAEAQAALAESTELFRGSRTVTLLLEPLALQAQCLVAAGRLLEAEGVIREARSYLAAPEEWGKLAAAIALAEALLRARQDRWSEAADRFGEALRWYRAGQLRWDEAWASFQWGTALAESGRETAEANAHLAAARDLWSAMGVEPFARQVVEATALGASRRW